MSAPTGILRRRRPTGRLDRPDARPGTGRDSGELTVEIVRRAGSTVVVATGRLGREGGELLAALVAHAQHSDGGEVTVDLREVSYADPLGVAAVRDEATLVDGMSAAVGCALGALVR